MFSTSRCAPWLQPVRRQVAVGVDRPPPGAWLPGLPCGSAHAAPRLLPLTMAQAWELPLPRWALVSIQAVAELGSLAAWRRGTTKWY